MDILEADSIHLELGGWTILQSVYVLVNQGHVTGLLGRNGSGKSSLLQVIFGTLHTDFKSIRINKSYVQSPYAVPGLMHYLPQQSMLPNGMTISRLISLFKIQHSELQDWFVEELDPKATVSVLSGGNKRLLEVMLILLAPVRFALLDEPFTHLSPLAIQRLCELIAERKKQMGILISDHQFKQVLTLSDQTYLLSNSGHTTLLQSPEADLQRFGYIR